MRSLLGARCGAPAAGDPYAALPRRTAVGTSSLRRQTQLPHARPDLRVRSILGNVQTRLRRLDEGEFDATMLAFAGLKRLEPARAAGIVRGPEEMVPAAGQGIVGITVRERDTALCEPLAAIEDRIARLAATAERACLAALDGPCRTPVGAHARVLMDGTPHHTGLIARPDGACLLRWRVSEPAAEAEQIGRKLGTALRRDTPADILCSQPVSRIAAPGLRPGPAAGGAPPAPARSPRADGSPPRP